MKKIVFYGDSNTYGFDPRDFFGGRYEEDVIWTSILKEKIGNEWMIYNEGMNGRQLPSLSGSMKYIDTLLSWLGKEDVFAVMLGTNDLLMTMEPDASIPQERMEQLVDWLLSQPDHPRILVIAPPNIGSRESKDPLYAAYYNESVRMNEGFQQIAEKYGIGFADASCWNIGMAYDGVHFSEEGHKTFATHMLAVIAALNG